MAIVLKLEKAAKQAARPPALPRMEKSPFQPEAEGTPVEAVGANRSILVVDDNEVVLKGFELKLKASGFAVTTTSNAATVASTAETARAELIILDINFPSGSGPDWSGFTVIQWLRRFPELAVIPVILISGEDSEAHREKARAEGVVAFFPKPVNYAELLAVMLRTLGIQQ